MNVGVALLTYNHAKFLSQALDSVLMQETRYSYEIFVLDDCSTDGTADILISYARRYPDRIHPILHQTNRGSLASFIELFGLVPGDYMALLDGDDCWTDSAKLQTQVDFLEENPDFVLCGHNCVVRNEWTGAETLPPEMLEDRTLSTRELLDFHVPSSSMLFRNGLVREWPARLIEAGWEDRPLTLMLCAFGKVHYSGRPMSMYRMHDGGVWSGRYVVDAHKPIPETSVEGWLKLIQFWNALREYFSHRYDDRIQELIEDAEREIARRRDVEGDRASACADV
jgi:glycosyltransferase involved in cell wall biosynthesis